MQMILAYALKVILFLPFPIIKIIAVCMLWRSVSRWIPVLLIVSVVIGLVASIPNLFLVHRYLTPELFGKLLIATNIAGAIAGFAFAAAFLGIVIKMRQMTKRMAISGK